MSENRPFGFDPDDFDRKAREVGDGIRDTLGRIGSLLGEVGFTSVVTSGLGPDSRTTVTYPRRSTRTTGEDGDGVWAVVVVDDAGSATVEEVYATELDALRANKSNTDAHRRVRFLPYGIAVSVLDTERPADSPSEKPAEPPNDAD